MTSTPTQTRLYSGFNIFSPEHHFPNHTKTSCDCSPDYLVLSRSFWSRPDGKADSKTSDNRCSSVQTTLGVCVLCSLHVVCVVIDFPQTTRDTFALSRVSPPWEHLLSALLHQPVLIFTPLLKSCHNSRPKYGLPFRPRRQRSSKHSLCQTLSVNFAVSFS